MDGLPPGTPVMGPPPVVFASQASVSSMEVPPSPGAFMPPGTPGYMPQPVPVSMPSMPMTPATPTAVINPLQMMPASPPVASDAAASWTNAQVISLHAQGTRFTKQMKACGCVPTGHDDTFVAPRLVAVDHHGCLSSFERSIAAARDVSSWSTVSTEQCGGGFCCCPPRGAVVVRTMAKMRNTMFAKMKPMDISVFSKSLRTEVNADKGVPIVVNDAGKTFETASCFCCCYKMTHRLLLGPSYDVHAFRAETGCFNSASATDNTVAQQVAYTAYQNSIGPCACIQSPMGSCTCGEQLIMGLRDGSDITIATSVGQAKEAVWELYRRVRHPMMPEPGVVRKIRGTTAFCGMEAELTVSTESLSLSHFRYPDGCCCLHPCQASEVVTMALDDAVSVRVEHESPCANACAELRKVPFALQRALESIIFLNLFGVLGNLFGMVAAIPAALIAGILGFICWPCRRSFVSVQGPNELAFRVRPLPDTGKPIADFAVELQQLLRGQKEHRAALMKAIMSGAGKDQSIFIKV